MKTMTFGEMAAVLRARGYSVSAHIGQVPSLTVNGVVSVSNMGSAVALVGTAWPLAHEVQDVLGVW